MTVLVLFLLVPKKYSFPHGGLLLWISLTDFFHFSALGCNCAFVRNAFVSPMNCLCLSARWNFLSLATLNFYGKVLNLNMQIPQWSHPRVAFAHFYPSRFYSPRKYQKIPANATCRTPRLFDLLLNVQIQLFEVMLFYPDPHFEIGSLKMHELKTLFDILRNEFHFRARFNFGFSFQCSTSTWKYFNQFCICPLSGTFNRF